MKELSKVTTWHGSKFDIRTGKATRHPATKPVATYEVKVEGIDILVRKEEFQSHASFSFTLTWMYV